MFHFMSAKYCYSFEESNMITNALYVGYFRIIRFDDNSVIFKFLVRDLNSIKSIFQI